MELLMLERVVRFLRSGDAILPPNYRIQAGS